MPYFRPFRGRAMSSGRTHWSNCASLSKPSFTAQADILLRPVRSGHNPEFGLTRAGISLFLWIAHS
jgi:hypothetical protein